MTNFDNMTVEEVAEILDDPTGICWGHQTWKCYHKSCADCWAEWLKQEVDNEDQPT